MTIMTNKKSKVKPEHHLAMWFCVSSRKIGEGVASLTNSEEEESVFIVDHAPPISKTRSGKQY